MPADKPLRAALYTRVSTTDQTTENQLHDLRRYCEARRWTATEYVDAGVSGAKDRRPALDRLMTDATTRKIDVVVCWRLDRFGRNLRHLVVAIEELAAVGVAFVSLGESIDTGTPTDGSYSAYSAASPSLNASESANASRPDWQGRGARVRSSDDADSESAPATSNESPDCRSKRPQRC